MTTPLTTSPHLVREYKGHQAAIYDLIPTENSDVFYSVGGDGWVARWDISCDTTDGQLVAKTDTQLFSGHYILDTQHLVVGDMQGHLYWIDTASKEIKHRYFVHSNSIFSICQISEDTLVTASADGSIGIWDILEMKHVMTLQISMQGLRTLVVKEAILYVGGSDNAIHLIDIHTWKVIDKIPQAHNNSVFALLAHEKGLVSGGRDAHMMWRSWNDIHHIDKDVPAHWFTINKIIDLYGTDRIASASRDKSIRLWTTDGQPICTLDYKITRHTHSVNTLLWMPKHKKLLTAGDDRVIKEIIIPD